MKLINGCSDNDLTFYNVAAKPECGIFHPEGGAIPVTGQPATCCNPSAVTPIKGYDIPNANSPCNGSSPENKHFSFQSIWIKGVGEDYLQDLVITACGVPEEMCDILGAYNTTVGTQWSTFAGSFATTSVDPSIRQYGFSGDSNLIGVEFSCTSTEKRLNMVVLAR